MSERALNRLLTVALLVAVAAPWLAQSTPPAFADVLGAKKGEVVALTAPGNGNGSNVLFLIDSDQRRLLVYEHRAGGKLTLTAVRNYEYEIEFEQWPGLKARTGSEPPVGEMKDETEELRDKRGERRASGS